MNQSTGLFTYVHDPVGRITTLTNPEGQVTSWLYDAASRVKATLMANGTLASNTYDNADQLLLLANLTTSGTTLSSFNYTYNPVGNRTQVVESNGNVVTWVYDHTYQLTNDQRSGANSYNITYVYDSVGNRTSLVNGGAVTTNTYNAGNELVTSQSSAGVTTSTYDGSGNLLTSLAPGNQWTTNTWDGENRLTRSALPSGIVDSFVYDGDGQRVQKQDSTGTTNHVWDGQNILLETNASNIVQVVYSLEPNVYGNLISQSRSGVDSFFLFDAVGSTRQLANSAGSVIDSYIYDSFGNSLATSGTTVNPFQYIGRLGYYLDPDSQMYYLRARIYNPAIGRFISVDPSNGGSLGRLPTIVEDYTYVLNNPVSLSDPTGLQAAPPIPPLPLPPPGLCKVQLCCRPGRTGYHADHCFIVVTNRNGQSVYYTSHPDWINQPACFCATGAAHWLARIPDRRIRPLRIGIRASYSRHGLSDHGNQVVRANYELLPGRRKRSNCSEGVLPRGRAKLEIGGLHLPSALWVYASR